MTIYYSHKQFSKTRVLCVFWGWGGGGGGGGGGGIVGLYSHNHFF